MNTDNTYCEQSTDTQVIDATVNIDVVLTDMGWLLRNSEDLDPEFNDIVNREFWNLI